MEGRRSSTYDDERRVRRVVGTNENDATVLVIGVEVKYEADEDDLCIIVAATSAMTNDPGTLARDDDDCLLLRIIYAWGYYYAIFGLAVDADMDMDMVGIPFIYDDVWWSVGDDG